MTPSDAPRLVPAPALREVAEVWWDVERDPAVAWDEAGRRFWLLDPEVPERELHLVELLESSAAPAEFAAVLAEGLASCDFPPTGECASPNRVLATLKAANRSERPVTS